MTDRKRADDHSGFETGEYWARAEAARQERIADAVARPAQNDAPVPGSAADMRPLHETDPAAHLRNDLAYKITRLAHLEATGQTDAADRLRPKIADAEARIARMVAGAPPSWTQQGQ